MAIPRNGGVPIYDLEYYEGHDSKQVGILRARTIEYSSDSLNRLLVLGDNTF